MQPHDERLTKRMIGLRSVVKPVRSDRALDPAAPEHERPAICVDGSDFTVAVRTLLAQAGVTIAPPGPRDYVLLVRGVPVAPWIPLRPAGEVWSAWLRRLEDLYAEWSRTPTAPSVEPGRTLRAAAESWAPTAWDTWRRQHVLVLDARYTLVGASRLASLLRRPRIDQGEIHLVGHSVGGAAVLAYLAGWRAGLLPPPAARLRTVVTLDAAVSGLAGVWSGARRYFASASEARLNGLNAWAAQRGIALLTAANQRDVWSHRALADLPYLGVRLGPASGLRTQLNGTVHGWLRRAPQFVEAVWGTDE